jgi:fluoride exporter
LRHWATILALSAGGAIGVNARHFAGAWIGRWAGRSFPWHTFLINVSGSFAIGFLAIALERWLPHPRARLFVVTGFLGGYTTFSAYSMESLLLWESGQHWRAWAYSLGSPLAGLVAVVLGVVLGRSLTSGPGP